MSAFPPFNEELPCTAQPEPGQANNEKTPLERAALNRTQNARSSYLLPHRLLRKTGSHFCARCSK